MNIYKFLFSKILRLKVHVDLENLLSSIEREIYDVYLVLGQTFMGNYAVYERVPFCGTVSNSMFCGKLIRKIWTF